MKPKPVDEEPGPLSLPECDAFRRRLSQWFRVHARVLPWRGTRNPYPIWVSEVMLQQTRVAAVLEHYTRFLKRFPTLLALALAPEEAVLAAWSGLGYYRRARMLHKGAQFVVTELGAVIPRSAEELRTLPGVGEYTSAAISSIAFGESIAVVDGNVERVLLRVTGRPEDRSAAGRALVREQAAALVPKRRFSETTNAAGDHNQAMMELGATICLPRAPLCLQCPVFELCRTRGEHRTAPRGKQQSQRIAFLLATRRGAPGVEVLLHRRAADASLMPGMLELPQLDPESTEGCEPMLRVRHSITNTSYYVEVFGDRELLSALAEDADARVWMTVSRLGDQPLTGLARKILMRLDVMSPVGLDTPARKALSPVPTQRNSRRTHHKQ